MNNGRWDDDDMEPLAPLPPHERGWRHPSEMGEQAWRQSEPPIAIGRGLAAATGVFGGLLGLALLMTMLPTHPGRTASAAVRSSISLLPPDSGSAAGEALVEPGESDPDTTQTDSESTIAGSAVDPRIEALRNTMPTYQLRNGSDVAVAVVVTSSAGRLVLTTADAVRSDLTVELATGGGTTTVSVLFVDQRSGLALLEPSAARAAHSTNPFRVASSLDPGDVLTFFGDHSVALTVGDDGSLSDVWELDPSIHDGSPVVNQRGELVALCSFHDGIHHLIGLDSLGAIEQALTAYRANQQVWLGVSVTDDGSGAVRVGAIDPTGPAASAGLLVGDVIRSVDGATVRELGDLTALLALHDPDDQVVVVVRGVDGSERRLVVTLAAPHSSI